MCVHPNKEYSQGTMTLTDNKEERLRKTKDLQCMMTHALASTALTDFPSVSGHFTRCWDFRSALRVTNTIVVALHNTNLSHDGRRSDDVCVTRRDLSACTMER